jgi:gamma-glutamylcyclotransferase (GGCT)/AIG2-like uncharacterized protein YtfP
MPQYLFSYGTLQPGLAPPEIEPLVARFQLVGRASVNGFLYEFGDYPGAVLSSAEEKVWGQIFVLPDDSDLISRLDQYEEFDPLDIKNSQFVRQKCEATLEIGEVVQAWIYVYNRSVDDGQRILNGDFAKLRR